jgi:hypothetical protein
MSRTKSKSSEEIAETVEETVATAEGIEEENEAAANPIDMLQDHGINVAEIKKLKDAGIYTIKGLMMSTHKVSHTSYSKLNWIDE